MRIANVLKTRVSPGALALLALFLLLSGCSTAGKRMHRVSTGMPKHQVIEILGYPRSTKTYDNVQVLHYRVDRGFRAFEHYYVRLVDGKVESFGSEFKDKPVTANEPPLAR